MKFTNDLVNNVRTLYRTSTTSEKNSKITDRTKIAANLDRLLLIESPGDFRLRKMAVAHFKRYGKLVPCFAITQAFTIAAAAISPSIMTITAAIVTAVACTMLKIVETAAAPQSIEFFNRYEICGNYINMQF